MQTYDGGTGFSSSPPAAPPPPNAPNHPALGPVQSSTGSAGGAQPIAPVGLVGDLGLPASDGDSGGSRGGIFDDADEEDDAATLAMGQGQGLVQQKMAAGRLPSTSSARRRQQQQLARSQLARSQLALDRQNHLCPPSLLKSEAGKPSTIAPKPVSVAAAVLPLPAFSGDVGLALSTRATPSPNAGSARIVGPLLAASAQIEPASTAAAHASQLRNSSPPASRLPTLATTTAPTEIQRPPSATHTVAMGGGPAKRPLPQARPEARPEARTVAGTMPTKETFPVSSLIRPPASTVQKQQHGHGRVAIGPVKGSGGITIVGPGGVTTAKPQQLSPRAPAAALRSHPLATNVGGQGSSSSASAIARPAASMPSEMKNEVGKVRTNIDAKTVPPKQNIKTQLPVMRMATITQKLTHAKGAPVAPNSKLAGTAVPAPAVGWTVTHPAYLRQGVPTSVGSTKVVAMATKHYGAATTQSAHKETAQISSGVMRVQKSVAGGGGGSSSYGRNSSEERI